ncbi:MAG: hypothetical protein N3A66_03665 [Planctomycetota bacterium]|nr:hypothetical protein [Planctomycetota bacterium]
MGSSLLLALVWLELQAPVAPGGAAVAEWQALLPAWQQPELRLPPRSQVEVWRLWVPES